MVEQRDDVYRAEGMTGQEQTVEAWVDVGGTFTDCFVRRPGQALESSKVLSSGRIPVTLAPVAVEEDVRSSGSSTESFQCREVVDDCDGFWCGSELICMDENGQVLERFKVATQRDGQITVVDIQADGGAESEPPSRVLNRLVRDESGARFELDAGLSSPVIAVRRLLGIPLVDPLPPLNVRLGTTRGTNALLTRTGAKTVFAVTSPFEDLLQIGDQTRPDLFALNIKKLQPLNAMTVGIHERLAADGSVLVELDEASARRDLATALSEGADSLAICLLHSPTNPSHEQRLAEIAQEVGYENISVSSELVPFIEILTRAQTTVLDAYLSPVVRSYLESLIEQFGSHVDLKMMTSAGGLVDWKRFRGKDCILSGPAGGVAALAKLAETVGSDALIGLDMGGTSTDVCRVTKSGVDAEDESRIGLREEYSADLQYESEKAGVKVVTPTLPIETVASGGGSICWFDGVRLRVGPQSAGAAPGPACYGRGGPLTVTDLNVYLGRVPAKQFPFPIDLAAIEFRLDELLKELAGKASDCGGIDDRLSLCRGFRKLANEQMAEAVRTVSIRQGADPRQHALVGFGGAAGQHICEIADSLGVTSIVDAPEAGLLSALGMGCAPSLLQEVVPVYRAIGEIDWSLLRNEVKLVQKRLAEKLSEDGGNNFRASKSIVLELRYVGTDSTLPVVWTIDIGKNLTEQLASRFHAAHQERFGYSRDGQAIELVAVRCDLSLPGEFEWQSSAGGKTAAVRNRALGAHDNSGTGWESIDRQAIRPNETVVGPCVILNSGSTFVLDEGWTAKCQDSGVLVAEKTRTPGPRTANGTAREPERPAGEADDQIDIVFRECFGARLQAIATQMGDVLQQTSVSVNVKRRRDYSCAVFDSTGRLLANAPHVPVHLGAMGETVRTIIERFPVMAEGDAYLTNDPYSGGSHLPDLTLVTPVFERGSDVPAMFVANRAHHADVGGLSPGSMSIDARRLEEEGVVIPPTRIPNVLSNEELDRFLRSVFLNSEFAPRNVDENLMDLAAQRAANQRGVQLLQEYAKAEGWVKLRRYGSHLLDVSRIAVENYFQARRIQASVFEDCLDDGSQIRVRVEPVDSPESNAVVRVDFTGTAEENAANFNANPSIVRAALVYVLRCMLADDLPLNEGVLESVDLVVPRGLLNPTPHRDRGKSPAMAAGNVETSQRVVDVLLGAFGVAAASQGTMNNLLFGNESFGFYETLCGGSGATVHGRGASAVHTHMTNTRITDPEVLETNFPVRLIECAIRRQSGGVGLHRGGDGLVREIEFLESMQVSLLTSRRGTFAPYGLAGGESGAVGENWLIDSAGGREKLPACATIELNEQDRIRIETPGGGGYGSLDSVQAEG